MRTRQNARDSNGLRPKDCMMRVLTTLSDLPEVSDLNPQQQRVVWRRGILMALRRPALPILSVGYGLLILAVIDQANRFDRHMFIPLFILFIVLSAIGFYQTMVRIVRPYLRIAREE